MIPARRLLEDMVGDLASGLMPLGNDSPLRLTDIRLTLPVEARFTDTMQGARVIADVPRLHTRTDFDLPLGRLTMTLGEIPAESFT